MVSNVYGDDQEHVLTDPVALEEAEKGEGKEKVGQILKELAMEDEKIPADPLEGQWF